VATTRNDTIRHLQAKVEELRSQIDVLETSKVDDVSALALPSTSREDAAKIEDLEEQVRNLKHAHAAQLRSQRKQFEKEVNELQEGMELERESSVVLPTAAVRSATARTSDPPTPPGAARRLWQRVKRPFQKR
jgi:DNA repair exonuclease SbcCD ATPase subunit